MLFIANLPHTSKQCDCVILSKSSGAANINPNHHNCARLALKQLLLITKNIKAIYRPQQPFLGRSNESCDPTAGKIHVGPSYEMDIGMLYISNLNIYI